MVGALLFTIAASMVQSGPIDRVFTPEEAARVVAFWSEPSRYRVDLPPSAAREGKWVVRLTPQGSTWLHAVLRARGGPKVPPGQLPPPLTPQQRVWEAWIDARVAQDRWQAALVARERNVSEGGPAMPILDLSQAPLSPGPIPDDLVLAVGPPPPLAEAASPQRHTIRFAADDEWQFVDNPPMRPRYAYYRFAEGVMSGGQSVRQLPPAELNRLFQRAGIQGSLARVVQSVSILEGGFDSINTYDTGFVSVGVIQFAALRGGGGSLGRVLLQAKRNDPAAFQRDFRRFGVDVTPDGRLAVIDPTTGQEAQGSDANTVIIRDKRLTAVFPRAGRRSEPFRVAQLQVAVDEYYPGDDRVTVFVDGATLTGQVRDFIRSEAGIATLMDRKVNTGNLGPLVDVLGSLARELGVRSLSALADVETRIINLLRYRKDYLADTTLQQPRDRGTVPSRSGPARGGSRTDAVPPVDRGPAQPPAEPPADPDGDGKQLGQPPKGAPPRPTVPAPHPRVEEPTSGPVDVPA